MARKSNAASPTLVLKIDQDDNQLLQRMIAMERLTRSDVVRRAIRAYAKVLGIEPNQAGKVA